MAHCEPVFNGSPRLSQWNDRTDNVTFYVCLSQFIQKRDPKYCEVKEETAWSMDRFNDYINENVAPNKDLPQDWVYGHLDVRFIFRL